jgi:uncharacterized cupredoxin-like copper-binding protein
MMTTPSVSPRRSRLFTMAASGAAALFFGLQSTHAGSATQPRNMPGMDMPQTHHGAPGGEKFAFGEKGVRAKVDRTVKIIMKDISFAPTALEVKVGETIRFVVTNQGELDHDFTLGDAQTQTAHRKEMADMLEKGGELHGDNDANAITVKPGRTRDLIWKFTRAGNLEFDCNIPGHYEAGMTGVIAVRARVAARHDMIHTAAKELE